MRGVGAALLLAVTCMPTGLFAQSLQLEGTWGNPTGCKYAKDGNYENDDMVVLKPDGIETYVTLCEWVQALPSSSGAQVVTGLCGHEGEDYQTVEMYIIEKDHTDPGLMRVRQSTGEVLSEVRKCP